MALRPATAIFVFLIVLLIACVVAWYSDAGSYESTKVRVFLVVLAGLGIVLTALFYYNLLELQEQQQYLVTLQQTTTLGSELLNGVLQEIKTAVPIIPNFALSLIPLQNNCDIVDAVRKRLIPADPANIAVDRVAADAHVYTGVELNMTRGKAKMCTLSPQHVMARGDLLGVDPCTPEAIVERTVLSYRIFSVWQEVALYGSTIDVEPLAYVTNFLQRANSPYLWAVWQTSKIDFNQQTQEFGELLFCYGQNIQEQTPEAYVAAATELLASGECAALKLRL